MNWFIQLTSTTEAATNFWMRVRKVCTALGRAQADACASRVNSEPSPESRVPKKNAPFTYTLLLVAFSAHAQTSSDTIPWTLARCLEYAETNNITIKQAALSYQNSEIAYQQSRFSRIPNLNGSASQSLTNGTSIDPVTNSFLSQQINATNMGLSSQLNIYNGGQVHQQVRQNALKMEQSDLYVQEAKNNVALNITEAYLNALYNYESVSIAEQTLKSSEKELIVAQAKFELSVLTLKELSDVQSQVANNQYSLVKAKNTYTMQVLTLKQLLELDPTINFTIEKKEIASIIPSSPDKTVIFASARANMPEIKASRKQLDIDQKSIRIASSEYLPSLSLSGSLNTGYTSSRSFSFEDQIRSNFNQRIGLSLSVPIFNRYATRSQVATQKINFQQSNLAVISAEKELYRKIETAWQNYEATSEEMKAAAASEQAAKTSWDLAQQQFTQGLITTTELIVSQNSWTIATERSIQARYMNMLYYQLLQFYQGKTISF